MSPAMPWSEKILLAVTAILLAVWPLPHTIALRWNLLALGLAASLCVLWKNRRWTQVLRVPSFICLLLLFGWILIHAAFIGTDHRAQLHELTGLWVRAAIVVLIGVTVGSLPGIYRPAGARWLLAGLFGTPVIYYADYLLAAINTGVWWPQYFYEHLFETKISLVMFCSVSASVCLGLVFQRDRAAAARLTGLGNVRRNQLAVLVLALLVFLYVTAGTRNGIAVLALLLCVGVVLGGISKCRRQKFTAKTLAVLLLSAAGLAWSGAAYLQHDRQWRTFLEDARVALSIDAVRNWTDPFGKGFPLNAQGTAVDPSNYLRLAWPRAGVRLIGDHPLGYGVVDSAFGRLAPQKWPDFKGHGDTHGWLATHSGWIDFTLGLGLPGTLLVWGALIAAWCAALRARGLWPDIALWALPTLAFCFLVAELSTGYFIEALLFFIAFFAAASRPRLDHPVPRPGE